MPRLPFRLSDLRDLRRSGLPLLGALLVVAGSIAIVVGIVGYLSEDDRSSGSNGTAASDGTGENGGEGPAPSSAPPYRADRVGFGDFEPDPDALRLVIPRIGIDAPVLQMGMDENNVPDIPRTGNDVGWYNFSARPGQGSNVVFAGHINWNRAPAVFANLDKVERGDTIKLVADDGTEYVYEVSANFLVDPEDPKSLRVMAPTKEDTVTLITCGGNWVNDASNPLGGSYDSRTIVQGHLV